MAMRVEGTCTCGSVRLEGEANADAVAICHCTDCQTTSGSAFRVSVPVAGASLKVTGALATYLKTSAESGNPRLQAFCPTCATSLYSTTPGEGPQAVYIVRVGMLKQRDQLMPKRQIWWRSARNWVTGLDGIAKLEKQS
jgi:hypothetical protein